MYKRNFTVDTTSPKECKKVIAQEILVVLSEENSNSPCLDEGRGRNLRADLVYKKGAQDRSTDSSKPQAEILDETQDETLESGTATSAFEDSAFEDINDRSLSVEVDGGGISSTACHSLSTIFCNAFS